ILVIGLDNAAGKTSILCHLVHLAQAYKNLPCVATAPTVPLQFVEFTRRNIHFAAWDMSGQGRYRNLWVTHMAHVHCIIFVVDMADVTRIAIARDELYKILGSETFKQNRTPVLILANKSDLTEGTTMKGFLTAENVSIALGVESMKVCV
ncbi:unnamed protein product, partial [Choristocarpus tenellus]